MLSLTEENYLKALVQIGFKNGPELGVGTNELAIFLNVKPATVNDMLKKLREKGLVSYEKYGKIQLTTEGSRSGIEVIRKHRLWETFLVERLHFNWDEVHEIAEQLEHIQSDKLVERLDELLCFPKFDPHGDAIPDKNGNFEIPFRKSLSKVEPGSDCRVIAVDDNSPEFLQYADRLGIRIGGIVKVLSRETYDGLTTIDCADLRSSVSEKFTSQIYVVCKTCDLGKQCAGQLCEFNT